MKYLIFPALLLFVLSGCGTLHKTQNNSAAVKTASQSHPRFLDNIEIDQESSVASQRTSSLRSKGGSDMASVPVIERVTPLHFKYAILMDIPVEELNSCTCLPFIEDWYGTPYRLGGNTKAGIDCSAFTLLFASTLYGLSLPRTSREQKEATQSISRDQLREGDLVFFATRKGRPISHVGVYLRNNKFVHASSSGGVMISDLDESYWRPRYAGAGRINNLSSSR
mgnify:CR=1 FL=1